MKSLEEGYLHPTVGYQVKDAECDLDYITFGGIRGEFQYALSNSLGFGGHNASILLKRYKD